MKHNLHSMQDQRGFTIVELLVSVFIFSIIVIAVGGTFTRMLSIQHRGSGAQKVQENSMYALELMAREIRVSSITNQDNANCTANMLTIVHPVNGTVVYALAPSGQIQRQAAGATTLITSKDVTYSRLNFCIDGTTVTSGNGDKKQARITIITQASSKGARTGETVTFDLQTTVVSRDNIVEFTSN